MDDSEFEEESSNLEILLMDESALNSALKDFEKNEEFSNFKVPVLQPGQKRPNPGTVWIDAAQIKSSTKSGLHDYPYLQLSFFILIFFRLVEKQSAHLKSKQIDSKMDEKISPKNM